MNPPTYAGANRGSYMNPEFDAAITRYLTATHLDDRLQAEREAVRIISTDVPIINTVYQIRKEFAKTGFTGVVARTGVNGAGGTVTWNAHEWTKR
jgi:ABC-type oligopeptide transport system substrate-binding subunit